MRLMLIATVLVLASQAAWAAHYVGAEDYSFDYPDDWEAYSKQSFIEEMKRATGRDVKPDDAMNVVSCFVRHSRTRHNGITNNINVVVSSGTERVSLSDPKEIEDALRRQHQKDGDTVIKSESGIIRVADRDASSVKIEFRSPNTAEPFCVRSVLVNGGGKYYTFTYTALSSSYHRDEAALNQVLGSLVIPPQATFVPHLVYFIFGGLLVAGCILAMLRFRKRNRLPAVLLPPPAGPSSEADTKNP